MVVPPDTPEVDISGQCRILRPSFTPRGPREPTAPPMPLQQTIVTDERPQTAGPSTMAGSNSTFINSKNLSTRRASVEKLQPAIPLHSHGTKDPERPASSFGKNRAANYSWYTERNPIYDTEPDKYRWQRKPGPSNHPCLQTRADPVSRKGRANPDVDESRAGVVTNIHDERQRLPRRKMPETKPDSGVEYQDTYRRNLMPHTSNPILDGGDDLSTRRASRTNPNYTQTESAAPTRKKYIETPLSALNVGTQAFQTGGFDLQKDKKQGIRTYAPQEAGKGICPSERKVESRQQREQEYTQRLQTAREQALDSHRLYHLYRARAETTSSLLKEHVAPTQVGLATRDEPLPPNLK